VAVAFRVTFVKAKPSGVPRSEAAQMITTVEPFRAWPFYRFKTKWRLREHAASGSEGTEIERAIVDFHQYDLQDFDAFQAVVRAMEVENETIASSWPAAHAEARATLHAESAQLAQPAQLEIAQPAVPQAPTSRRAGRFTAALASRPGVEASVAQPAAVHPAAASLAPAQAAVGSMDVLVRHATEDAELYVRVSPTVSGQPTFNDVRLALEAVLAGASAEAPALPSGRRPRIVMKRDGVYKGVNESEALNGVREVVVLGVSLRAIAAAGGHT